MRYISSGPQWPDPTLSSVSDWGPSLRPVMTSQVNPLSDQDPHLDPHSVTQAFPSIPLALHSVSQWASSHSGLCDRASTSGSLQGWHCWSRTTKTEKKFLKQIWYLQKNINETNHHRINLNCITELNLFYDLIVLLWMTYEDQPEPLTCLDLSKFWFSPFPPGTWCPSLRAQRWRGLH